MPERKRFLLRMDPRLYAALERWAADELRSVNAQIEYVLTEAAKKSGRIGRADGTPRQIADTEADSDPDDEG